MKQEPKANSVKALILAAGRGELTQTQARQRHDRGVRSRSGPRVMQRMRP